jgi:hypothetical protein
MIFIGLDVSKISTALCIDKNNKIKIYNYTNKKSDNIWIKEFKDIIEFRFINYDYKNIIDYSQSEIKKIIEFDTVTNLIINDIYDNVNITDSIKIGIEGFSYNSKGPIFDLIEFTTLLKDKLIKRIGKYSNIEIISPLTLKVKSCKMVFEPRIEKKGKKTIKLIEHIENDKGKSASKFDKWDMLDLFINSNIDSKLKDWCVLNKDKIYKNKEVPKPIDDVVDSIFLKEIKKRENKLQ